MFRLLELLAIVAVKWNYAYCWCSIYVVLLYAVGKYCWCCQMCCLLWCCMLVLLLGCCYWWLLMIWTCRWYAWCCMLVLLLGCCCWWHFFMWIGAVNGLGGIFYELLQGFQMSCPFLPKRWFTSVSVEKWGSYIQKLAKVMPNFPADNCTNRFHPLVYRKCKHVGQRQRGWHF